MTQGSDGTGCSDLGVAMGKFMMTSLCPSGADKMVGEQKANSQGSRYWDGGQKRARGLKERYKPTLEILE